MDSRTSSLSVDGSQLLKSPHSDSEDHKFIIVGKNLALDLNLKSSLKNYDIQTIFSDTGFEFINDPDAIFVLENFEGSIFKQLHQNECRVVGSTVVIEACDGILPYRRRPLYTLSMEKVTVCFCKETTKSELCQLADMVHFMGGAIKKEVSLKVTHLIAWNSGGEKYKAAMSMGVRIMTDEWIKNCWARRNEVKFQATQEDFIQKYKWEPFRSCILSFHGFSKQEVSNFHDLTKSNGGQVTSVDSGDCSHLIINEKKSSILSQISLTRPAYIVVSSWFWASIQMEACADENLYQFQEEAEDRGKGSENRVSTTPQTRKNTFSKVATPLSSSGKSSKRRRLQENLAHLASEGEAYNLKNKNFGFLAYENKAVTRKQEIEVLRQGSRVMQDITARESQNYESFPKPPTTPRQHVINELFQTESNYVSILSTLIVIFKNGIEKADQPGGSILDSQESKNIFGEIQPIFDLHLKINSELRKVVCTWDDYLLVGEIFLKHIDQFIKCYPAFVNYFERTTEFINKYSKSKPRFQAFLKLCQDRSECGRQTLPELMIRPVQRLPSVLLLLRDLLKKTEKSHPDYSKIEKAITSLEEAMKHINEDKRKTESHQKMFDVVNSIENCPANLLSAHRSLVCQVHVLEVNEVLSRKGDLIRLFVFSDSLEICKRRLKAGSKSPAVGKTQKIYKHLNLVSFSSIKRIINIEETNENRHLFALITKRMEDKEEKLLTFSMNDPLTDKGAFLTILSKTVCDSLCRPDYETLMATCEASVLNIDPSEISGYNSLSRAANKFSKKVSRAFSLNKSPTSNLKRAINSMSQIPGPRSADVVGNFLFSQNRPENWSGPEFIASSLQSLDSITPIGSTSSDLDQMWNDTKSCHLDQTVVDMNQKKKETIVQSFDNVNNVGLFATPRPVRTQGLRHNPLNVTRSEQKRPTSSTSSLFQKSSSNNQSILRGNLANKQPATQRPLSLITKKEYVI